MRFRLRSLFLFTAVVALLVCLAFPLRPIDGFIGSLFLLFEDGTVWADGYSDAGFKAVRVGMSRSEVYKLLGKPITSYDDRGRRCEYWSAGQTIYSSYRQREVVFKGDTVVRINTGAWID